MTNYTPTLETIRAKARHSGALFAADEMAVALVHIAAAEQEIARLTQAQVALETELVQAKVARQLAVERYAKTVDDPDRAHLHYDGCPYKPYADLPRHEEPENVPDCTCAEAHMGAYWKGQFVLERGYHDLTKKEVARLQGEGAALREALLAQVLANDYAGDPCFCGNDARNPPLTPEHIPSCLQARAALAPRRG